MNEEELERVFREWEEEQQVGSKVFQAVTFFFIVFILAGFIWCNYV